MVFTSEQIERYKRHILLPEIGGQGQQKLLDAKVLVIGAGGLGAPILYYLAAAGIGHIGICDDDKVNLSNLQRQILYTENDLNKLKIIAAATRLKALNPDCATTLHPCKISKDNAQEIIADYDLIIEGVDNFEARYILNNAAITSRTPLLSAAIGRFDGQISLFMPWAEKDAPCYRCFVPEPPPDAADCETQGVLGAVPGVVGSLTALEALKFLTGMAKEAAPKAHKSLILFDGLQATTRRLSLKADPACTACMHLR